jgi:hypothetical protein
MHPFRFTAPVSFRACAVLLTLLCARAHAQAEPTSVTIVGTFQSELGCLGDWDPACSNTWLDSNPVDGIWRKLFTVPGGPQEFKVALNGSWEENYGANAQRDGANLSFSHTEDFIGVKFFYDPATHWVTNSSLTPIAVLAGSLQSELGCPGDWDPACMRTWLKDLDGDGVQELRIPSLPANTYELKVTHHESWEENYGQNGERDGANIPFTVPAAGQAIRFLYESWSHLLTIHVAAPTATTLTVSPNPSSLEEDVTLTAVVTVTDSEAIPSGTVTFKVEGQELGTAPVGPDGVAALTTAPFPSGTAALTAEYSGNFESSLSVPVILQTGYRTTTTLTVTPGSATAYGEQVTLEATVMRADPGMGSARGDVYFLSGDTVLGFAQVDDSGRASLSLTTLGAGAHALTARFALQAPFLPSFGQASHTVNRAASQVMLTSSANPSPSGQPVTLTARVSAVLRAAGTPGGSVTFLDETNELATVALNEQGEASYTTAPMEAGQHGLTAAYSGDALFAPHTSATLVLDVRTLETPDSGTGDQDGGSAPDAGSSTDGGTGESDAGTGDVDAGPGDTDAGPGDTDAGTGNTDAGPGDTDAGTGNTDAGTGDKDAGSTPGNDAGTQGPDAGTGAGNTDAGTSDEPGDETASGCGCGAGTGGGSPLLLLGMWMGLTAIQSRRRSSRQARG